jgi:hypothetical protein
MRLFLIMVVGFLLVLMGVGRGIVYGQEKWHYKPDIEGGLPGPNDVFIAGTGIQMPVGRVLLIRQGTNYCALRFTQYGPGQLDGDVSAKYASYGKYETYYQSDGTGDFSGTNLQYWEDELILPVPRGFGRIVHAFGAKHDIRCGPIKLDGNPKSVSFYAPGQYAKLKAIREYNIELAPTPWTSISEINVRDPRITWYRYDYDGRRRLKTIPIDRLWPEK